jgi:hypothetical protein
MEFFNIKKQTSRFFTPFFSIVEEFHHRYKAMGGGSASTWLKQHNEPTTIPLM